MTKNRFTRNISANTIQLLINQFFGLVIFYALSRGLSKELFGQVNWSLAVLLTVFGVLGLGIDQVMVKKIAAGYNPQAVFNTYLFHVLISGSIVYSLLLLQYLVFPASFPQQYWLLLIGLGKLFIFFSSPCKQLVTGLEKFRQLLFMSVLSNIVRGLALLLLLITQTMSAGKVLIIFIAGDLLEFTGCILLVKPLLKTPFRFTFSKRRHYLLVRESLPQTGVIIFTAIMSRLDWIMVGWLVSSNKLADYSFAWKAFEVAGMPLLVIAPMMVPMFTRMLNKAGQEDQLPFFLEWQIIIAAFIALLLNLCWVPVIDFITNGKYGSVNRHTIFLLSLSMPLLYYNNYLWTLHFARGALKRIFFIMAVSFAVNVASCSLLIPLYKNEGAAISYFITMLVQLFFYMGSKHVPLPPGRPYALISWPLLALLIGVFAYELIALPVAAAVAAGITYTSVVLLSGKLKTSNWKLLQSLYQ